MQNAKYCHKVVCGNIVGVFPRDKGELRRWMNKCRTTARACTYDGKLDWFAASRTIPYVRLWQDNLFGTYYARDTRDILFHENNDPEDTLILSDIAYYYWALNENKWREVVDRFKSICPDMPEEQIWNEARANIINDELQNYGVITYNSARIWASTNELVREVEEKFSRIGFRDMYMKQNNAIAKVPVNHTVAAFTEPEMVNPTILNDRYFQEIPNDKPESAEMNFDILFNNQVTPEQVGVNPEMDGWVRCIDSHPNQYGAYNYTNTMTDWQNQQRLYAEQNARAYNQFMNPYQNRVYVPQPPASPGFGVVSTPNPFYPSTPQQQIQQKPMYNVATKDEAVNKVLENNPGYKKEDDGTETLDLAKMFGTKPEQPKEKLSDDLAEASKLMASTLKNGDKVIADINQQQQAPQQPQMPMMGFNPLFYQNSTLQNMYNTPTAVTRNEDGSYRYEDEPQGAKPGDKYLIPTREEIESGKCFYSYVTKNGESFKDPTLKLPKKKVERKNKPFRSCVTINSKTYGDPEVIENVKKQKVKAQEIEAALDYKDAATKIQNMDKETEMFLLINTLKKYNKYAADQLAFMKDDQSVSPSEFADMLDQSLQLLEGYQKQDPLASVKAPGVRVENKKLIIDKTQKNVQDAMQRVVNIQAIKDNKYSTIQEAMQETGMTASEIQIIMKYRPVDPNELMTGKIKAQEYQGMQIQNNIVEQMSLPNDNKEMKFEDLDKNTQLIYQLQALTNLRVVHSEEEYNRVKEWESRTYQLNPYQNNRKNMYLFWKDRMRTVDETKDMSDQEYASWFDKWWNAPSNIANGGVYNPYMYATSKTRAELRSMESERRSNNLKRSQAYSPYIQEAEANTMKQRIGQVIQATSVIKGKNLYDFVYGEGFSTLCYSNLQERYRNQQNNVRRMFNVPLLQQNMMNGTYATPSFNATPQQYSTLMNSDRYNDRRQRFINKIFSKEEMRPTAKRYFYE